MARVTKREEHFAETDNYRDMKARGEPASRPGQQAGARPYASLSAFSQLIFPGDMNDLLRYQKE